MNGFWSAVLIAAVLGTITYAFLGTTVWPLYLLLIVGLAAANTQKRSFWRQPKQADDVEAWDYSRAARLRRRKLGLAIERIKHRIPFARLEAALAIVWLMINFSVFFVLWVLAYFDTTTALIVFIGYLAFSSTYVGVTRLHSWASSRWPETQKVHVWGAPQWVCDGHVAGQHIISMDLPTSETPGTDGKFPTKPAYFELVLCKYVKSLPKWLHAKPVLVIADASLSGQKAGYYKDLVYEIDCRPDPYVAGDMEYWRLAVWLEKARGVYGNSEIPDNTIVVLATERIEPERGELTALPPTIVREMYAMRARNMQVENYLDHYTMTDKAREGVK